MIVLGIESSCDETAAAVVRDDGLVLSDVVASQIKLHAPYGGVVPELASRAHLSNIVPVIEQALAVLPGGLAEVDGVAVTQGPGLVGALLVGVQAGKALAWAKQKPLIGVNHLVGHLLAVYLRRFADLLGECAGQEGFRSFEARCAGKDLALFVDAPGSYVIVATSDLLELRRYYRPSTP